MKLFIRDCPLSCWTDNSKGRPIEHWDLRLPVIPSEPGLRQPNPGVEPQQWVLDTGYKGEALAWRHHLTHAGMDPDILQNGTITLTWSAGAQRVQAPVREGDLWLVSNVSNSLFQIELDRGIVFRDENVATPDLNLQFALIGIRCLVRTKIKIEIDFSERKASVWIP